MDALTPSVLDVSFHGGSSHGLIYKIIMATTLYYTIPELSHKKVYIQLGEHDSYEWINLVFLYVLFKTPICRYRVKGSTMAHCHIQNWWLYHTISFEMLMVYLGLHVAQAHIHLPRAAFHGAWRVLVFIFQSTRGCRGAVVCVVLYWQNAQIETYQFSRKVSFSSPGVYAYQLHACTQQTHAISTDVWCFEPKGQAKQQIQFYRNQFSLD